MRPAGRSLPTPGLEGVHGRYRFGKRNVAGRLLKFCHGKVMCVANTWFEEEEQRKTTYSMGGNKTVIDFVLVGKSNRKY